MYKSRRVPFSLFVNIPLTTPRINFRISECHHRFSIDLIIIFSAQNGKLFLDHTDPLIPMRLVGGGLPCITAVLIPIRLGGGGGVTLYDCCLNTNEVSGGGGVTLYDCCLNTNEVRGGGLPCMTAEYQ